jgi:hypothetical protein
VHQKISVIRCPCPMVKKVDLCSVDSRQLMLAQSIFLFIKCQVPHHVVSCTFSVHNCTCCPSVFRVVGMIRVVYVQ